MRRMAGGGWTPASVDGDNFGVGNESSHADDFL
jgi:hypothetical protein